MLARRLPTIMPNLDLEEAIETTKVHSITGLLPARVPGEHLAFQAPGP